MSRGNETRLREILHEWEGSPDAVIGDGIGAELIRIIRKSAQIQRRLPTIESILAELRSSDLYRLQVEVGRAEAEGRDLLAEMASRLDEQIVAARSRFRDMSLTRPAP